MTDQNVCPYCGWGCVEIVGSPYSGIGRGRCPNCQSNGPEVSPPSAAIFAFCHPAHLMQGMAHKWERICDGEELADVAGEGGVMEAKENVCPYCGADDDFLTSHRTKIGRYAKCCLCGLRGPVVKGGTHTDAVNAYCVPAALHTYNPAMHIALAELRAALEGEHE